tara:strand:+ start:56311 stop:58041 length:1731 start_codon:yes stop_codon:yes gene_type:complete
MNYSAKGFLWTEIDVDKSKVELLSKELKISLSLANILVYRNIEKKDASNFLNPKLKNILPNPSSLKDLDKVTEILVKAIIEKKKIGIIGDYDVDGATSTALICTYLKSLMVPFEYYIPDRIKEGYGPNINAIRDLKSKNCELIITVDCGTTATEALKKATLEQIIILVVDHHQPEENFPEPHYLINPNRCDDNSGLNNLAAVGVSFFLLISTNRKLSEIDFFRHLKKPNLIDLLDLVALGTICDVVTLDKFNRSLVKQGLKIINNSNNFGIRALIEISNIDGPLNEEHIGYIIGPKINAGGRVGKSLKGVELLLSENELHSRVLAKELSDFNHKRQMIEKEVEKMAMNMIDVNDQIICVNGKDWHEGVIGIVSAKITEKFSKPSIVISESEDLCKGSCRSVTGFDIGGLVKEAAKKNILESGGGHQMAAGLTIKRKKIINFKKFLSEYSIKKKFRNAINKTYDLKIFLSGITEDFFNNINKLAPFGPSNSKPKLFIENCFIKFPKLVGNNHISFYISDIYGNSQKAIAFKAFGNQLGEDLMNNDGMLMNVIGYLSKKKWNQKKFLEINVIDVVKKT